MRVLPGERSLTKASPEERKAPPPNASERTAAPGDRTTSPRERLQANRPEGTPVPDSKVELPPVIRRTEVVAFALVSLLVICVTAVLYEWEVSTTRAWMNLLSPLMRPAFEWNHDWVMARGGEGLARLLGCKLLATD